jgi:hypothetical protein
MSGSRGGDRLSSRRNKARGDVTDVDEELLWALGGQAAASIENAILLENQPVFEGFVGLGAAIESRDPPPPALEPLATLP